MYRDRPMQGKAGATSRDAMQRGHDIDKKESRETGMPSAPDFKTEIMDLLVTGGSGFLGSQFIVGWLQRHTEAHVACLIRAPDDDAAAMKLQAALLRAADDGGLTTGLDALLARATAIRGDLTSLDWVGRVEAWRVGAPIRILHCAANLSFRANDREAVRQTNVDGTRIMLDAARALGATEFNYVSTAYIAGDRVGTILEDEIGQPSGFTNAYEESKWEAEAVVRIMCAESDLPFRIFRPSIIIGHSVTHRLSALSGFYKVAETMQALGRSGRAQGETILLPMPHDATLDLIPVDVVVAEMIELLEAGATSQGHAFHLTSDIPLPLVEVLRTLSPLAGFTVGRLSEDDGPASKMAEFLMQRLRYYMPYLGQTRSFDRSNVHRAGVTPQTLLDVERLRHFVTSFLAREG